MVRMRYRLVATGAVAALLAGLTGCGSPGINRAPVEDRGLGGGRYPATASAARPGAENADKPGYYTVKPGDTLIRIGLDAGQNWRDIVRWNNIDNPNQIEVGQVLRIAPPTATGAAAPVNGVVTRPIAAASVQTQPVPPAGSAAKPAAAPASAAQPGGGETAGADDQIAWIWPVNGPVLAGFDEAKNKGLDLGGNAGDPVLAAADGRVVYAGAGLRGYGNLIILKHNNTYLTAYAHNQTLLVKEDQTVRKGQKIAEMGSSDADRVKLHFEVRRQGKPVDPAKYLPAH